MHIGKGLKYPVIGILSFFFYKTFKKLHSEKNKKNIPVVFLDTREELENCYFIYQNSQALN